MGPIVRMLVESSAGRGEVEEVGGDCCGARPRRIRFVGDMCGIQIRGDLLCDFWRKRSEVVVVVAVGICWGGEVVTSHAGRGYHPVLLE